MDESLQSLAVQRFKNSLDLVSTPKQIKEIQKHEQLGEKAAVTAATNDGGAKASELALEDPGINQITLQGKEWMPPKERQYLNAAMQLKGHNEASVDELIDKLTLSFEAALNPRDVKLLEQGSFKSLNDLIADNIALNRGMVIVNKVDDGIWNDFKAVVKEFAQYEKANNLEKYSDMPEVDVFDTDVNAQLAPGMLKTLNKENPEPRYELKDIQKFLNTLNKILAANVDDNILQSYNTEDGLVDLYKSLSNDSMQRDIKRMLLNKGEEVNIFNALLTTMEEVVKKQTKAEESPETSPILGEIESAELRKVLEILIPDIAEIDSASALETALEKVDNFALNRALLINKLERADLEAAIAKLLVTEKVY